MLRNTFTLTFWMCSVLLLAQPQSNLPKPISAEKLGSLGSDTVRVAYLLEIAKAHYQRNPKLSLELTAKALAFARRSGSKPHLMDALSAASKSYFYAGYSGEAAAYIEEFAELAQRYGTDINKAYAYNDLAVLKTIVQHDRYNLEAKELFEKALALFLDAASRNPILAIDSAYQQNIAAIYSNLGNQYKIKGDYDLAESYMLKALGISEKTSVNTPLGVRTMANLMDVYRLQSRKQDMYQLYERGLQILEQQEYYTMYPIFYFPLAEWYESQDSLNQAITFYEKVYEQGKNTDNYSYIRSSATRLSRLYEQIKNPKAALKFSRIADESKAKENQAEIVVRLKQAELKAQFQTWEQEVLQKNEKRLRRIRWITFISISLAVSAFLLWYRLRRKHQKTKLKKLEIEMSAQKLALEKNLLENELEASNKALTTEVMRKIQNKELISNTVTQLLEQSRIVKPETGNILRSAAKTLRETLEEDTWKAFEVRFKQVDQRFYDKLAELCPDLTVGEKRVCAFLRLDMSSKEISALTGQSVRAVELMRGRVRKKLGISNSEVSLTQFLSQV